MLSPQCMGRENREPRAACRSLDQFARTESHGFTLVEIVIALALLTLAATGLLYISSMSTSGNTRSDNEATATALAVEKVEELKNRGYNALYTSSDGPLSSGGASGGIFTRAWQVSGEYLVGGIPAKRVTVAVSWTGGGRVVFSTQIVNPTETAQGVPDVSIRSWNQTQ